MADGSKAAPSPKHPPHSIGAEQSFLGGLLLNNAAIDDVTDLVTAGDFLHHNHRTIVAGILAMRWKQQRWTSSP